MKRIAFDTNVLDAILGSPTLVQAIQRAATAGELLLVSTHVQEDELAATPNAERRAKLLALYHALPVATVATHGFVIGVSRVGMARIGGGSRTGVAIDDLDSKGRKHRRDALIGVTAAGEADVLVTCERRLRTRMKAAGAPCEVWNFDEFRQYVLSVSDD